MKKFLVPLFILCAFFVSVQVQAFTLDDAFKQIESLRAEIAQLRSSLTGSVLGVSAVSTCINGAMNPPTCTILTTPTTDLTPRISYWSGKVNQHVDIASGTWQTDLDGSSGANIDKLTYCKKFYPNTTSVVQYKNETINSWQNSGNTGNLTSTRISYKCVGIASSMCTDSDGGNLPFVAGIATITNPPAGAIPSLSDRCYSSITGTHSSTCSGPGCQVMENYCIDNNNDGAMDVYNSTYIDCQNGCKDGACLQTPTTCPAGYIGTPPNCVIATCANGAINPPTCTILTTRTVDHVARISYWPGKINQHVDIATSTWQTDVDGVSGSRIDKLTYCRKFWPDTISVTEYVNETINTWKDKGNINDYTATRMSYKCIYPTPSQVCPTGCTCNGATAVCPVANFCAYNEGSTNYPSCSITSPCTNGATNYPACTTFVCPNGASNYPTCTTYTYCLNGATNSPTCTLNQGYCLSGETNYPVCTTGACANGATDYSTCSKLTPITKTLIIGMGGNDVKTLQIFLGVPTIEVDGIFGLKTQALVMKWQTLNGLYPDGIFRLEYIQKTYVCPAGTIGTYPNCAAYCSNGGTNPPLCTKLTPISRTLKSGMTGNDVKTLQIFLKIPTVDGNFSATTKASVMNWQFLNGLKMDGVFGPTCIVKAGWQLTSLY